jgi:hypothetical protein
MPPPKRGALATGPVAFSPPEGQGEAVDTSTTHTGFRRVLRAAGPDGA